MLEQFPICEARLPSFGRVWATRVRSWCSSRSCTCKKREAGGSSPRPILSERSARTPTPKRVHRRPAHFPSHDEPQHRDKLLARGEEPQPGSHVISPRRGYMHHGICVGDGKVVHYAGLARGWARTATGYCVITANTSASGACAENHAATKSSAFSPPALRWA